MNSYIQYSYKLPSIIRVPWMRHANKHLKFISSILRKKIDTKSKIVHVSTWISYPFVLNANYITIITERVRVVNKGRKKPVSIKSEVLWTLNWTITEHIHHIVLIIFCIVWDYYILYIYIKRVWRINNYIAFWPMPQYDDSHFYIKSKYS